MATTSIKTFIRVRTEVEGGDSKLVILPNEVYVQTSSEKKKLAFQRVFNSAASQTQVFDEAIKPYVNDALQGYRCTVFVYGQTGTGKTYTMEGRKEPNERGIIPQACFEIFRTLNSRVFTKHTVNITYFEIYNEEIIDLLEEKKPNLKPKIYDDEKRGCFVQNVAKLQITNYAELLQHLMAGGNRRQKMCTLLNKQSSRSHSIFTIEMSMLDPESRMWKHGKINFVDLAGSENASKSGIMKTSFAESSNINKSLLALGRVIIALNKGDRHVPFRESNLTRVLKDSLDGNTKTVMIATIDCKRENIEESIKTLHYAHVAQGITNTTTANVEEESRRDSEIDFDYVTRMNLQMNLQQQIGELKKHKGPELAKFQQAREQRSTWSKNSFSATEEEARLNSQLESIEEEIRNKNAEYESLCAQLNELTATAEKLEKELANSIGILRNEEEKLALSKKRNEMYASFLSKALEAANKYPSQRLDSEEILIGIRHREELVKAKEKIYQTLFELQAMAKESINRAQKNCQFLSRDYEADFPTKGMSLLQSLKDEVDKLNSTGSSSSSLLNGSTCAEVVDNLKNALMDSIHHVNGFSFIADDD